MQVATPTMFSLYSEHNYVLLTLVYLPSLFLPSMYTLHMSIFHIMRLCFGLHNRRIHINMMWNNSRCRLGCWRVSTRVVYVCIVCIYVYIYKPRFWLLLWLFRGHVVRLWMWQPFKTTVGRRQPKMARCVAYYYVACWEGAEW